jgi:hypothetical protein
MWGKHAAEPKFRSVSKSSGPSLRAPLSGSVCLLIMLAIAYTTDLEHVTGVSVAGCDLQLHHTS